MKKKNGLILKIRDELMTFFENVIAPYMDKEFDKIDQRFNKVESRLNKLENDMQEVKTEIMYIKNDIRDLKADMPTKEEYRVVKKLEKIHQRELTAFD